MFQPFEMLMMIDFMQAKIWKEYMENANLKPGLLACSPSEAGEEEDQEAGAGLGYIRRAGDY